MPTFVVGGEHLTLDEIENRARCLRRTLQTMKCWRCEENAVLYPDAVPDLVKRTGWSWMWKVRDYFDCPRCGQAYRTARAISEEGWGNPYTFLQEEIDGSWY